MSNETVDNIDLKSDSKSNDNVKSEIDSSRTVYCMNLKSRTDRWEQTVDEIKKLGDTYQLIRYEATENKTDPISGHSQTFRGMIQMAKDSNMKAILIGEDDLVLCEESKVAWEAGLSELPDDWDILLGGAYYVRDRKMITPHLAKISDFCATHFILIRNTAFDLVLDHMNRNLGFKNIDRFMGKLTLLKKLNTYLVWPMMSSQREGYSDLRKKNVNDNTGNKRKGLVFLTIK